MIIATYNWSAVLPYSIGSVLRQTFRDFELLVVGDGCTDDSERVVAAIDDRRVRWINLPENSRHQSAPNNEGLRQARGELIAYLGHDDLWLPHHLESHVKTHDETNADVAYSLCLLVAAGEAYVWPSVPRPRDRSFSPPSGMTHRRAMTGELGGWRDYRTIGTTPDVELWRRAYEAEKRFSFVPRMTAVKFPAGWRRNVYRTRPSHEQARWLARIDAEPDLESTLLVNFITADEVPDGVPYRDLLRHLRTQTIARIRRRFVIPSWRKRIDDRRRFKGLD